MTGKQHAGDFIDLLGDGRVRARGDRRAALRPRPDVQGAGRAGRDRAGGRHGARLRSRRPLVVCLGDNIFEHAHARGDSRLGGGRRRRARVRQGRARPGELRRGRVRRRRGRDGHRREGGASSTSATRSRPHRTRSSASTATRPTCSTSSTGSSRRAAASSRSPTSTACTRSSGRLQVERVEGWWHDGGKHWADLADVGRLIEETGANK